MAVAGLILTGAAFFAASSFIRSLGGDPEGEVANEAALFQGLTALEQTGPLHKASQRLDIEAEELTAREQTASDFGTEAREVGLGRRVTGARDLLESVSQRMGTTPEALGQKLSPTRMGDFSSLSRAAFGRSAKRMGPPNA